MPRIVPLQLLKCLRVLLDDNGGILSTLEVKRIAGLMAKYSKKLVSKCVYVQILKSTKTELLGDFMGVGGWSLVYTWLNDAIRAMNWPLVQEILELLLLSPVDVSRLRINSAPIIVKGLCKDGGNEGVRILAKRLVEQWLKIVTENTSGLGTTTAAAAAHPHQAAASAMTESTSSELTGKGGGSATDSIINKAHFMENSSSDSTDSGGAPATLNYTITSALRKSNSESLVIKLKASSVDRVLNGDNFDSSPSVVGDEDGAEANINTTLDNSVKSNVDDSGTDSKGGEDADRKHKSSRDKNKRSEKDRDKDRKSSSHRSSSSSHKSSSSSSKSTSKTSSSSSSSSSHHGSSEKHRDKDKRSTSSKERDKERSSSSSATSSSSKHKSSSKSSTSSSSSSSSSSSKDRNREKEKERSSSSTSPKKELEKDNKLMPPPTVAAVASEKKADGDGQKPKSIPIPHRKASISIEVRRDTEKAATVKTYQSKFRSHGLTEEAPPPPSRKGLKKPTSLTTGGTTPTVAIGALLPTGLKRLSPPPREMPCEKKPKIDINNVSGHVERPGAAKLIAPKKICHLVETNLFSDALAASIEPKKVVKRKRSHATASPTETPLTPLKFYQDTLDESKSDDKSDDSTKENDDRASPKELDADDDDIPLKKVKEDIDQKVQKEKAAGELVAEASGSKSPEEEDTGPEEPKKPGPGCGPDGPPGVLMLHRRKGPKKKLTWQPEEKLTQIRYFEVDHSERINVTKQSFLEMKNMERFSERDAMNISRRGFDDNMEPQMEWRPLIEVDNVPEHPNGNLSKQRTVQADREATTLRALYFSPDMIPDSGAEAELEPHFAHDIPVIPMDDLTGNPDAVNDYSTLAWPDPKGYAPNSLELGGMNNMMGPGMGPNNMMGANNPFQPFGNNFMPNNGNMPPNQQMPPMNMQPPVVGPPAGIWQNPMGAGPMMNPMNAPPGMDINPMGGMPPPNFMGGQFGSPGPFGAGPPPGFNNYPPMMMNGPGPGPGMMNGPGPGPMPNGMGPMPNGGPRNNNNRNKNNGGGGGNWRSGGNNFQDNSGGGWRPAGSGPNRGGPGGNNTGICKQFMRGHCHMGKSCKYVHPKKRM